MEYGNHSCFATWKVSLLFLAITFGTSCTGDQDFNPENAEIVGEEIAELTLPPTVPPPIDREHATKVIVNMEVVEQPMRLSDGVEYTMWTFGGSVPGRFIRVREGDMVEFHLQNHPDNKLPHNIDLHSVNGPGGGAESTFTAPGRETVFSFRALNPGLYVYHCATAPVGMHIANGMYGLILVEPWDGLPEVDQEYYVMQSEFYTGGEYGERGLQPFDMNKAIDENPPYVVFNGSVGSMMNDQAITANRDETVRLFVGNGGPNLTSSFHVIGEIFDRVYYEGGSRMQENVQTTSIPAGGSSMIEFKTEVPGSYILVDHAIFRAFNKGALATLTVSGEENTNVYTGQQLDRVYQPEGGAIQELPVETRTIPVATTFDEQVEFGRETYMAVCQACHMADGSGIEGVFPPVSESDYLNDNPARGISAVVHGLSGEIVVNGETYNSVMPAQNLNNEEVANVVTFLLNSFGNDGGTVTPDEVASIREQDRFQISRTDGHMMRILTVVLLSFLAGCLDLMAQEADRIPQDMVFISGGTFLPFYSYSDDSTRVHSFYLDSYPVTNSEYLEFVTENPDWRRSQVKAVFAGDDYLHHWAGDLDLGINAGNLKNSPVTNISWFAARAYARWKGRRLPTMNEWEYVASASGSQPLASRDPAYVQEILDWYSRPNPDVLPAVGSTDPNYYGVYDMHGLIWEWVEDFNTVFVSGESRGDQGELNQFYCAAGSEAMADTDKENYAAFLRYAFRGSLEADYSVGNLGFRTALTSDI